MMFSVYLAAVVENRDHTMKKCHFDVFSSQARVYSCSADGTVIIWDVPSLKVKRQFHLSCDRLQSIQVYDDALWCGKFVISLVKLSKTVQNCCYALIHRIEFLHTFNKSDQMAIFLFLTMDSLTLLRLTRIYTLFNLNVACVCCL